MIITISSEKGGTGKTTISTNLAIVRAKHGRDVFFADADSQKSASDFFAARSEMGHEPSPCCAGILGAGTYDEIRKMSQKFDDVIVDVGGRDTITLRKTLLATDIVLIPFIPSQFDVWGLDRMDGIIGDAKASNDNLRAICIMNKVDSNPRVALREEAEVIARDLKNIEFLSLSMGFRVSYRRCVADGISVTELSRSKRDEKAYNEMMKIYGEVFKNA
ncbi:MAG: AAA family ATPase [Holosporaceae bacterium]|jgi:chromosome partitioning protein|nr:AAA family ATPase [Holosporaceae bacterium]